MPQPSFPTGTITFLFTDIEGSTKLVERLGPGGWPPLLDAHHAIVRAALEVEDGQEIQTEGDAFFAAFVSAPRAVAAAARAQRELTAHAWPEDAPIRVRMGLHTGEGTLSAGGDYVGLDVHRAARISAAGHGGQVLLSAATAALATSDLPPGTSLRDLGSHRLKDLAQPEHLSELVIDGLPDDHPPLRTLDATPNNLPLQLTTFVGREREVVTALQLLDGARLLTLTGPGGTGKTRLSLQVAAEAAEGFPDGVFFVPLATITDPAFVPSAVAEVLGLPDTGSRPLAERIADILAPRSSLLVLDNFEQVLEAAPFVAELLRGAPRLKVLVSSRAALRVSGEQQFAVPALGLPDQAHLPPPEALSQYEAVALFIQRAVAVQPGFQVTNANAPAVAQICARLDGLPLAIELAAARIRILSPEQMLARLQHRLELSGPGGRDLPDRQRTLRGAIGWSWDLLDEPLQALLGRLSVFVGGASLEAIEAVCDPAGELGVDVLDGLDALVGHSLVRSAEAADEGADGAPAEPRFIMLETIREFAAERLDEAGQAGSLRERHAAYFRDLAERASGEFLGPESKAWLDRIEAEQDNLRAALGWALDLPAVEVALAMVGSLWRFWQIRGHLAEGAELARRTLELPGLEAHPAARLRALDAAGGMAYWQADMALARDYYAQSLELLRRGDDSRAIAEGLYNLAMARVVDSVGDGQLKRDHLAEAERLAQESLDRFRALGDQAGEGRALWALGNVDLDRREFAEAEEHAAAALAIFRRLGDRFMVGWALYSLGVAAFVQGDPAAARTSWTEALQLLAAADDVTAIVLIVDAFSWLTWLEGDRDRSLRLGGFAEALESASGTRLGSLNRLREGAFSIADALADPRLAAAHAAGRGLTRAAAIDLALAPA